MRVLIMTVCALCLVWPASTAAQKPADTCLDGRAAMDTGDAASAVTLLEDCLATRELEPEAEVQTYAALGAAYLAAEAYEDALSAYNMAFAIADTQHAAIASPTLWRNRGIARRARSARCRPVRPATCRHRNAGRCADLPEYGIRVSALGTASRCRGVL